MRITVGMAFIFISLMYSVSLNILFFTKKHVKNYETKLFSIFLPANLLGLLLELSCTLSMTFLGAESLLAFILTRLFLIYLIQFLLLLLLYIYVIFGSEKTILDLSDKQKTIRNIFIAAFAVFSIVDLFLPMQLNSHNGAMYSSGIAVSFIYVISALASLYCIIKFFVNLKSIKKKKNIPMIVYMVVQGLMALIQQRFPEFTIATSIETLVIFLMYFTIENPDVKMIQALEVAREQADKANRAKTEFLSSMSHEIRTPLNAIVGFSNEILEAKDLDEAQENAKDIVNASDTLLEIVNGILDISKIEAGKIEIINKPYNAPETFEELAKLITPKMKEKGLDFTYSIAPDLPGTLFGDHANLKKVVTNFLSNAYKYTDRGYVHYEVNCVNTKDVCKLIISVEDSGRGIRKESVDKMFTKFQRLDEDRNTTIEGTGLGLAITKQLVELMGGRVIVHTVYGEGSKFTAVLNQRIETMQVQEKKKVSTTLDLKDIRTLIVDDTPLNLKVACKLLERFGANQLVTCESGFECLDLIKQGETYDLILLDDMMPKMSGVETLRQLKEIPGFKTPTIALTANAITGMREKYLADGFDDYLAKPIEREQLIQVINQVLGRSATEEIPQEEIKQEVEQKFNEKQTDEESEKIIPVEENIEEILGKKLDRNYQEETNDVEELDVPEVESSEMTYDQNYLESNGVDMNKSLELLGDMEMYNMTINDFTSEVENKWNDIVKYKNDNNMSEYAILVHSLKSDCKYLGFMTLADIAYQHELKSKENDSNFVNEHFKELEDEYLKVLNIAKEYVNHNK